MGLVILITKSEVAKLLAVDGQIPTLCENIREERTSFIYTPLKGKLLEVLNILSKNDIIYQLKSE
jgi:hypothetical protein